MPCNHPNAPLPLALPHHQPGDGNYELSMEYCMGNVDPKFHTFQEPHQKEVHEMYAR